MGLTFKKEKALTGLAGVANPTPATQVKLDKKQVGTINPPSWRSADNKWYVGIMIEVEKTAEEPAGWKWIFFKTRFDEEPQAREWLQRHWEALNRTYKIHSLDFD